MSENTTEAERTLIRAYRQDVINILLDFVNDLENLLEPDDAYQWLHDTIDGHRRVTITWLAKQTLLWSENSDAYFEQFGTECMVKNGDINWSALAFAAFERDVLKELSLYGLDVNFIGESIEMKVDEMEEETESTFNREAAMEEVIANTKRKVLAELKHNGWIN